MERHIGKRLGIPCAVISAPVHVQDFPARYSPQMGFEGANVIFDTWVHPLVMGLEEHLLHHVPRGFRVPRRRRRQPPRRPSATRRARRHRIRALRPPLRPRTAAGSMPGADATLPDGIIWLADAERELKKIPFFVRGKAAATPRNSPPTRA